MKPFSITAPEEIAKEYGGNKKKIQQAAAQGMISPTEAVLAGMFVDRMRNAATAEQVQQASVAEQVMNPQPQMPPQGMAATPQAQQMQQPQMQQPMAPRMGQPSMGRMPQPAPAQMPPPQQPPMQQPQGMAMGGGLDSIDFVEQSYAPGGVVGFSAAGGVSADREALLSRRNQLETDLRTARIQGDRDSLTQQINAIDRQLAGSTSQALSGIEQGKAMERQAQAEFAAAANQQMPNLIAGGTPYPQVPTTPGQLEFELPSASPYGPESSRIDPNRFDTGTLTEEMAREIEAGSDDTSQGGLASLDTGMRGGRSRAAGAEKGITLSELFDFGTTPGTTRKARREATEATGGRRITDPAEIARLEATPEGRAQAASGLEDRRGTLAEQVARMRAGADSETMVGDGALREMGRSPFGLEQPATLTDQIAAEQEAARETQPAANTEETAAAPAAKETELSLSDEFTAFQDKMKDIMPKNEFGEYRKKFEQMMEDTKGTMQKGRKDAFSMALLQAGLGMLGQQGGQTALQALGKAALPATKQYMDTVKGLKKEERELLKLGLSLEQMDAKEKAAATRTMANLFGQERTRQATLDAAELRRSADNKFYDEYGAEAYEKMMRERASAGALARLPQQQQKTGLEVAKARDAVIQDVEEKYKDPLSQALIKQKAEEQGVTVAELKQAELKKRLAPFGGMDSPAGGQSGTMTFSSPEAEAAYNRAMGIK